MSDRISQFSSTKAYYLASSWVGVGFKEDAFAEVRNPPLRFKVLVERSIMSLGIQKPRIVKRAAVVNEEFLRTNVLK